MVQLPLTPVSRGAEWIVIQEGQVSCYMMSHPSASTIGTEHRHQGLIPIICSGLEHSVMRKRGEREGEEERERGERDRISL